MCPDPGSPPDMDSTTVETQPQAVADPGVILDDQLVRPVDRAVQLNRQVAAEPCPLAKPKREVWGVGTVDHGDAQGPDGRGGMDLGGQAPAAGSQMKVKLGERPESAHPPRR